MVFFITVLRALAACLITNAHYTGIYPTDIIANGGLLGDIIFFAVSGYCLYNIKNGFFKWYGKRIYRVYVPTAIITFIYFVVGWYSVKGFHGFISWFIYPTHYHFVASIIFLYIPFYFCMKIRYIKEHLPITMLLIMIIWLVIYVFAFDKSSYHIDDVYSWMIRFLFAEAMLLGAWFRQNDSKFRNKFKVIYPIGSVALFILYFASKMVFGRYPAVSSLQFLNQIVIFALLFFIFATFSAIDAKLEKIPKWIKSVINFISVMTLEIYVVQYALEDLFRDKFSFPANWIVLTLSILVCATALHYGCKLFYKSVDKLTKIINSRNKMKE